MDAGQRRAKKGGLNLILADPRETDLVKNAAVHLKVKPGMDIFWIKALGKIIVEKGWQDQEFYERQTIGFKALRKGLDDLDIDAAHSYFNRFQGGKQCPTVINIIC